MGFEGCLRHGDQRAIEVVEGVEEIGCETLDAEFFGVVYLPAGLFLEVAEVGDRAEVFVLCGVEVLVRARMRICVCVGGAYL